MTTRTDRIAAAFARTAESGRSAALIPYIAAGDPSPAATVPLMHALVDAGADVLELGVPFSDPMADGPVIQRAADRAIAQGVGLARVLDLVAEFRQRDTATPVVLMGYANPIERMGQSEFARRAGQAGVDGVLVVDYPPEEVVEFAATLGEHGIAPIFLLAPTSTEERIKAVAAVARGYVYYVSLKGVTGAGSLNTDDVAERVALIRRHVRDIPVGVGFGIRDAESAQRVARAADAVVIGSKLIETMEQAAANAPADQKNDAAVAAASGWLRTIRQALDQVKRENASA
ncbi:tryptophan synthase subunit alpha [Achromobacter arsenitoxydans]|uniref:Tryptophan synthase alpha chain n=1 Tax=Achromobacter arsenitoxydans SY8 TaxID=477184 RepID=H0F656_9BURK|nr:tryptophan synthase subunit alpha [Achromobacter arsenitoxydans]EHK66334.1 tryptophan synthase subunit alpha [Achromobacter arsenitoxydans SY8]